VKRAEAAGIVVIAVDVEAAGADATVQTDNLAAGRVSCAYLADRINGKGNVIIQNGPQVSSIIARVKGCKESLAGHPGIKILSDNQNGLVSREGGLNVMSGDLTRFSDIQAVFTVDDPQAVGANLAATQLHRSDFIITSVDGAPDIVNALKSKTLIQASASQDPAEEGKRGVDIGYGLMNGKSPAQKVTLLAPSLVTRDNVAQYKGW
jgi:ribose transport system substrate-binding protein